MKYGSQINPVKHLRLKIITFEINYWVVIIKMRYSTELIFIKYVKGLGFLSFGRKFGDKFFKKPMDAATKTGIDAAKTASKRIVQKTAGATSKK